MTGRKIAIYNKWWSTFGGGEKYTGGMAQALSEGDELTLLVHEPLDLGFLSERLDLDLSRIRTRMINDDAVAVSEASADYDVFINSSFTSDAICRASAGLYVTYFPTRTEPSGLRERVRRVAASRVDLQPPVVARFVSGFHLSEQIWGTETCWTKGEAVVEVPSSARPIEHAIVALARQIPASMGEWPVTFVDDETGELLAQTDVVPASSRLPSGRLQKCAVPLLRTSDRGRVRRFRICSPTFDPSIDLGGSDQRRLGVPVVSIELEGERNSSPRPGAQSLAAPVPPFLHSYDKVISISEFTRSWVSKWWGVDSELLYPLVTQKAGGQKEPMILSVGRFFSPEDGHSKKQLEMVSAFSRLLRSGVHGWEYHLVGGCERAHRGYLREVQNAAAGMPIVFHVNATGEELNDLYGRASIYWHATGLGEQAQQHPERLEHFGITTAEAMSAGAVPVVIGSAGQLETVTHGHNGFHFADESGLVSNTRSLITNPTLLDSMSTFAEAQAATFAWEPFRDRTLELVDSVCKPRPNRRRRSFAAAESDG